MRLRGPNVGPPYTVASLLPYPILTVAAGFLLVSLAENKTLVGWFFSTPLLRLVGRLSYSLYLLHVSIIMFLVERLAMPSGTIAFNLAYAAICVPVALMLYYGWERWFLKLKDHLKPAIGPWPAIVIWTALGIGGIIYFAG